MPADVCNLHFAEAVLNIATASARLLDKSFKFTKSSKPVKIEGLWYYPMERDRVFVGALPYWSEVVYYQNTDNSLVDMIWFAGADGKKFLTVHGYDYSNVKKDGVLVPTKIEIFETDAGGLLQQKLVKIAYK